MGTGAVPTGPDLSQGVALARFPAEHVLAGRVGDAPVLVARVGAEYFAVDGACTHYGAALADGLVDGETVRCPLHHACFSLRTGAALSAPAFDGLERWRVEIEGGRLFVRTRIGAAPQAPAAVAADVRSVVIVGGGAAGFACADRLRRLGYDGKLTIFSADPDPPCDRPNLSKDYLAGTAPEEWIPLRGPEWYHERSIDLRLVTEIVAVDPGARTVIAASGETWQFDRLLLATGAEPVRLPGLESGRAHVLRSLADARALVAGAEAGARAAIVGSSFIGLEAAAALRARGFEVEIISLDTIPFERVLGRDIGAFFQRLHERQGVRFRLGRTVAGFDGRRLKLDDGSLVEADFVLLGVGVRPRTALAETAGIAVGNGILVDPWLETNIAGIHAAGDAAAYPDPLTGRPIRVEHWVAAERQGQAAAANMLGLRTRFEDVPFFWTEQYGVALRYVGHAPGWDEVRIDGAIGGDFTARYYSGGALRASASVGRDRVALEDELLLERRVGEAVPLEAPVAGTPAPLGHPG